VAGQQEGVAASQPVSMADDIAQPHQPAIFAHVPVRNSLELEAVLTLLLAWRDLHQHGHFVEKTITIKQKAARVTAQVVLDYGERKAAKRITRSDSAVAVQEAIKRA
jgi:hypothetical protein